MRDSRMICVARAAELPFKEWEFRCPCERRWAVCFRGKPSLVSGVFYECESTARFNFQRARTGNEPRIPAEYEVRCPCHTNYTRHLQS